MNGWASVSPELRVIIERVCTPKEVEALKLKAGNMGYKSIALVLRVSPEAIRARLRSAERKILEEVAAMRGIDGGR